MKNVMKKIVLLLLFMVSCAFVMAQSSQYQVTASSLNVRKAPNPQAAVVGKLDGGTTLNVYEIDQGWAKIIYKSQYAYISSKHIKKLYVDESASSATSSKVAKKQRDRSEAFSVYDLLEKILPQGAYFLDWLVFVILGLSVVLAIFRRTRREDEAFEGGKYVANLIIFMITCVVEIIYFLCMADDSLWFCMPNDVEWWCVLTFPAFGWIVYNQVMCYIDAMVDFRYNHGDFDLRWGWYSLLIGIVALVVTAQWLPEWHIWLLIAMGIFQLVQIVLICMGVASESWSTGEAIVMSILGILLYLAGLVATVTMLVTFIALLIIVVIIGFFVMAFLSGGKSSSRSSSGSKEGYIETSNGRRIYGSFDNNEEYFKGEGRRFRYRSGYGDWEEY